MVMNMSRLLLLVLTLTLVFVSRAFGAGDDLKSEKEKKPQGKLLIVAPFKEVKLTGIDLGLRKTPD